MSDTAKRVRKALAIMKGMPVPTAMQGWDRLYVVTRNASDARKFHRALMILLKPQKPALIHKGGKPHVR
jgi:hypothetical protein